MPAKPKCKFKKHVLKPLKRDEFTPRADSLEPTESDRRGYWPGSMYTNDELQWLKAVEALQRRTGRKFLSHVDYQRLALALGYTPPASTTPPRSADAE